jgi:hypothetical protein
MSAIPNVDATLKVHPFIGFIGEIEDQRAIKFNPSEVQKILIESIDDLSNSEYIRFQRFRESNAQIPRYVKHEKYPVWGLTAFTLYRFLEFVLR